MEVSAIPTIRELVTEWGFRIDLRQIEKFDNRIGQLRKKVDGIGKNIQHVAQQAQAVGTRLSIGLTLPIVGLGALTLRAAGNFEAGMNKVDALAKIVNVSLQELENQARELGETTKFSAGQAADAMGFMAQAGLDSQQIFNAMPDALNLAAAANIGLAETADLVTNVMAGMGIESTDLTGTVDILTKTFTSSNTDLSQLGQAMKQAGPVAKTFGVGLTDVTAILGRMGNAGFQGSLAGRQFKNAIAQIAKPSKEAQKVLSRLGVTTTDSSGNMRNFVDILEDLEKAGASGTDQLTIFGRIAGPAMSNLIGTGIVEVRKLSRELEDSAGIADKITKKQLRGLNGAWITMKSALEGLSIAIAKSGLLEFVTSSIKGITVLVRRLSKLNPKILRFATIVLGVVAAIGPLIFLLGSAVLAFRALAIAAGFANVSLFAIPIAILAIIAAIALLVDDFLTFQRGGKSIFGLFVDSFKAIGQVVSNVFDFIAEDFRVFLKNITEIPDKIDDIVLQIKKSLGLISEEEIVGKAIKAAPIVETTTKRFKAAGLTVSEVIEAGGTSPEKQEAIIREQEKANIQLLQAAINIPPTITSQANTQPITVSAPINITVEGNITEEVAEVTAKTISDQVTEQLSFVLRSAQNEAPALE